MTASRRLLVTVLAVAVLIAVGFVVRSKTESKGSAASPERAALIAAAALPDCPSTTRPTAAPGGLPKLTLPCLGTGPSIDLSKLTGPMVVNIWAGTCTECRVEAPNVRAFAAAAHGKVAVLGVVDGSYPSETWNDALDASRGLGLHYPSVFDAQGRLVQWTKAIGIPASLLIRPDGSVAYAEIGALRSGQLQELVQKYLGIEVSTASPSPAASGSS